MISSNLRRAGGSALILGALLSAGCNGIEPGDYRVYRVAFESATRASNCFDSGAVPVNQQDDTSSQFVSGTFVLYVAADSKFYLDTGTVALRGTETGEEDFNFEGTSVVVEVDNEQDPERIETTSSQIEIQFNVDGEVVEGNIERTDSYTCEGMFCDPDDDNDTVCTQSAPFIGGEVSDVEVRHEI